MFGPRPLSVISSAISIVLVASSATAGPPARPAAVPAPAPPLSPNAVDVRAELPEAARRSWDAAKQLAGANDFKAALVEFTRAYEQSKNPRVLFNIGVTEKLLTHYARAVGRWDQELKEGAGRLSHSEVAELKNAIAIVQQFVSTVEVTANESGATLYVDDYPVGETPFGSGLAIDVGKRSLRLSKAGFKDAALSLDVAAGTPAKASFKLEPVVKTAIVSVAVTGAPAATIFMDGKDMGPAPFKGEVTAERHTFEARASGFVTVTQTGEIGYRESQNITLALSAERHEGKVIVDTAEGTIIEIDGKVVGSKHWEGIVPSTQGHQLVVKRTGYQTYSNEIVVGDDQTRSVNVTLNKEVATSWVWWTVGALAVIGGSVATGYFVLQSSNPAPYSGTLNPGATPAIRFGH